MKMNPNESQLPLSLIKQFSSQDDEQCYALREILKAPIDY